MMRLLGVFLLLGFFTLLGLLVRHDPGYVLFAYHQWSMEMPLWAFILVWCFSVLLMLGLRGLGRMIFGLPKRMQGWQQQRRISKAARLTQSGIQACVFEQWAQAKPLLTSAAKIDHAYVWLNYLLAGFAAHQKQQYVERDTCFQQAQTASPQAEALIHFAKAKLLLKQGDYQQAAALLLHLREIDTDAAKPALRLLIQCYRAQGAWDEIEQLLPQLKKKRILSSAAYDELCIAVYVGVFQRERQSFSGGCLLSRWLDIPKSYRYDPRLILAYSECLDHETMTATVKQARIELAKWLQQVLAQTWHAELVIYFVRFYAGSPDKLEAILKGWLQQRPFDAELLYACAVFAVKQKLWGQAKEYLSICLTREHQLKYYHLLIEVLEACGEQAAAQTVSRQALAEIAEQAR